MKILIINTVCGYGSTCRSCKDLATVLEKQGHECYIAYGQGTTDYTKGYKIGTIIENHIHNIGSRVTGKQGYFTTNGTIKLIQFIKSFNPDIIHLDNLHGNYLNLKILFEYLIEIQKPIVWCLHDCWAFTGKCTHYSDVSCYKWETECGNCPQIQKYPPSIFFDQTEIMFRDKKKWFTSIKNMTIIPVSKWLAGEVEKSFLKKYPITTIYNWVNNDLFKDSHDINFLKKYGLQIDKFSILLVSASWNKLDVKWQDALKLAASLPEDMQLIMIGKVGSPELIPKNIIHIPYLHEEKELALAYSFSDVYVHLSTEDTFAKVIAEALSCGTPAIVYDSTACAETIGYNCGYVVEKRNIILVLEAINKVQQNTKAYYSKNCRERVIKNYDFEININKKIKIFKNILKGCL